MADSFAPIVLFCYRRAEHLRNTLLGLMDCKEFSQSKVIVYGDGPSNPAEAEAVLATRDVIKDLLGEKAECHFSDTNLGLAHSVISGVTDTVNRYGRAIVVEDDLEVDPDFLSYMNRALEKYADESNVYQISGFMYGGPELPDSHSAAFLPLTVSWGWATWKRAWDQFDPVADGWQELVTSKSMRERFNLDGAYDFSTMLEHQMKGKRDSWAIRWYWTVFRLDGLVLFPPKTLVNNTGFDGSGTHGGGRLRRFSDSNPKSQPGKTEIALPAHVELDLEIFEKVKLIVRRSNGGVVARFLDFLRRRFQWNGP